MNSVNGSVSCFLDNVRQSTASMRVTRASGKCFSVSRSKWFQRRVAVDRLMHRSGGDMALFCFFEARLSGTDANGAVAELQHLRVVEYYNHRASLIQRLLQQP